MPDADERRSLIILGVCTLLSILGAVFAWKKWGPEVQSADQYKLQADQIIVPPQPEWIPDDVLTEVIRDGGLEELLVTDPALLEKIESAFGVHTWVATVNRVRKRPGAEVEVEMEYRRPVALVEVMTEARKRALQPVDGQGYVLPTDFLRGDPARTRNYLRILADYGMPAGPVGTPWGNPQVAGAAKICEQLQSHWMDLGLYRVVATSGRTQPGEFELHTVGNSRIIWGNIPGFEQSGEPNAASKINQLLQQAAARPFDSQGPITLDLRVAKTALAPPTP